MTSDDRFRGLKAVAIGDMTIGLPTGWQVAPRPDGSWWCGDPDGVPALFVRMDVHQAAEGASTSAERVAPFVEDVVAALAPLDKIGDTVVEPVADGMLVHAVLADAEGHDGCRDVRWYVLIDHGGDIAFLRYRLVVPATEPRPPELADLIAVFDAQARRAEAAETPDAFPSQRVHGTPPAGSYDALRTTNIDGIVEFRVPERWRRSYRKKDLWWFYDPEVVVSMNVTYSVRELDGDPEDVEIDASLEASALARLNAFARPSTPQDVETWVFDGHALARGVHEDPPDDEPEERLHYTDWHLGRLCGDRFVFVLFQLMVPISLAEAPAFRELAGILDAEIRGARLAPPRHPYPSSPTLDERKYNLHELRAEVIFDGNLCLCVPNRWNWVVDEKGAAFDDQDEADGEETGTLWIDYSFFSFEREPTDVEKIAREDKARTEIVDTVFPDHREVSPPSVDKTEDGFRVWRTYDAWSEGELLRFVRCDRLLWRPEGLLMMFFSFVLPVVMADDPEMVELRDIVVREVNLAWIA